ncbi:MAG TPA: FadR/GntR family transcriptional regulator [Anaerolineae bacterium]|jgi:DNA-binding FadR family transcriptional regulator|nr:FadR/GntR family transcriptional regulator [Anaerolineae bacterium]
MEAMHPIRRIDTRSMHEELLESLKEFIVANRLQAEDPLPTEAQLSDQLGVSRAAVREGLRSLESLGMIYSRRGEGRFVRDFNLDPVFDNLRYSVLSDTNDVQEIMEVRLRLEAGFIGDAIAAMTPETLAQLRDHIAQMRINALSGEYFLDRDLEFHAALYRPINNPVLDRLLDIFGTIYESLRGSLLMTRDTIAEVRNHEEILQAIEAGDVELARRRLRNHFGGIMSRLVEAEIKTHAVPENQLEERSAS